MDFQKSSILRQFFEVLKFTFREVPPSKETIKIVSEI